MIDRELVVANKLGLHARPAAMFVRELERFKSAVKVSKDGLEVNGKSVMGLMLLAAECGSRLRVVIDGPDEKDAFEAVENLWARKFEEE